MDHNKLRDLLRDYHWKLKMVNMSRNELKHVSTSVTAQYGIESTLPKGKGNTSDSVLSEVTRRDTRFKQIVKYEKEIDYLNNLVKRLEDDRLREVVYWIMEGDTYSKIANGMGCSERHIRRLRDQAVSKMLDVRNA